VRAYGARVDVADRARGSLLGLALGDALGAPFEFMRAASIPDPVPAFELPWLGQPPGSTTDDTAMAMNLAESLVERGGFDPDDIVQRHVAWFRTGPPDVGNLTRRVLGGIRDETAAEATRLAREVWERRGPEVSAGNGSVMYCAPLGVAYANQPEASFELTPALSALTHFDQRCRTACLAVTLTVAALVRGEPAEEAIGDALAAVQDREGGEELEFLTEAVGVSRPVDGPDQGFCLYAAAVGLQAAVSAGDFENALIRVVRLGGDTDTSVAVAGALLGARDGRQALPADWLARLHARDEIERLASQLPLHAWDSLPST
jgi:ADP-ribosyl-[dinitrogen reductase] hydrolase